MSNKEHTTVRYSENTSESNKYMKQATTTTADTSGSNNGSDA